jgi:hypothetical protein
MIPKELFVLRYQYSALGEKQKLGKLPYLDATSE